MNKSLNSYTSLHIPTHPTTTNMPFCTFGLSVTFILTGIALIATGAATLGSTVIAGGVLFIMIGVVVGFMSSIHRR